MVERLAKEQWFLPLIIQFPVELCFTYSGCGNAAAICKASFSLSGPRSLTVWPSLILSRCCWNTGRLCSRGNRDSTTPSHPTCLQKPFCCDTKLVKLHLRTLSTARHCTKTVIKTPAAPWKPTFKPHSVLFKYCLRVSTNPHCNWAVVKILQQKHIVRLGCKNTEVTQTKKNASWLVATKVPLVLAGLRFSWSTSLDKQVFSWFSGQSGDLPA